MTLDDSALTFQNKDWDDAQEEWQFYWVKTKKLKELLMQLHFNKYIFLCGLSTNWLLQWNIFMFRFINPVLLQSFWIGITIGGL